MMSIRLFWQNSCGAMVNQKNTPWDHRREFASELSSIMFPYILSDDPNIRFKAI